MDRTNTQLDAFDSGARARAGDPATSKAAAASVAKLRASQKLVLRAFVVYGDMDDGELKEALGPMLKDAGLKMSDSGIRSRRSELSKPNMERLAELRLEWYRAQLHGVGHDIAGVGVAAMEKLEQDGTFPAGEVAEAWDYARRQLRHEGFRSKLWDTGKRNRTEGGRETTVWGIAQ